MIKESVLLDLENYRSDLFKIKDEASIALAEIEIAIRSIRNARIATQKPPILSLVTKKKKKTRAHTRIERGLNVTAASIDILRRNAHTTMHLNRLAKVLNTRAGKAVVDGNQISRILSAYKSQNGYLSELDSDGKGNWHFIGKREAKTA